MIPISGIGILLMVAVWIYRQIEGHLQSERDEKRATREWAEKDIP